MSFTHYWEAQERRWYEQYLEAEKTVDEFEQALRRIEIIALDNITDESVRASVRQIVDDVWRGKR
jgi:hypothetical protein